MSSFAFFDDDEENQVIFLDVYGDMSDSEVFSDWDSQNYISDNELDDIMADNDSTSDLESVLTVDDDDEEEEEEEEDEEVDVEVVTPPIPVPVNLPSPQSSTSTLNEPPREVDYNLDSSDEEPGAKRTKFTHSSDNENEGTICSICLDNWTSCGDHRLSSLKCGHLFGHKCIQHWIKSCSAPLKRCPQCNVKATLRDIRLLYADKLSAVDTSELENYKKKVEIISSEKEVLESKVNHILEKNLKYKDEIINLKKKISYLESNLSDYKESIAKKIIPILKLRNSVELSHQPGCRILDFNSWSNLMIASQASPNQVFPGYGIRKIAVDNFKPLEYIHLHMKPIRDFSFHPDMKDMLLTVSLDKSVKISTICSNSRPQTFLTETPLWSCCWDRKNLNYFYVGTQNGIVIQYDLRNLSNELHTFSNSDRSGVISIKSIERNYNSLFENGGFIACRLNSCHSYKNNGNSFNDVRLPIDGPFTSMSFDNQSKYLLLSTRPNNKHPHARHSLLSFLSKENKSQNFELKNTFLGSTTQTLLSRSTQFSSEDDHFVAADQESTGSISIWSLKNQERIVDHKSSIPIYDIISFKKLNTRYLATVSEKSLFLYNFEGLC